MAASHPAERDVSLTTNERRAWRLLERELRGDVTCGAALLDQLRRIGWKILQAYAHLYLPPDVLVAEFAG